MPADGRLNPGTWAEDEVATHVLARGWTLLGRRCRTRHGELDVVALDDETLVVIEVKYRRQGDPAETVTPRKRQRLRRAAEEFAVTHGLTHRDRRFDVAAVSPSGIQYVQDIDIAPVSNDDEEDTGEDWT